MARRWWNVIPPLERIIGPQPALPERDAQAAQNLFNQVCQDFVQAVCRPEEPLVLFLDDLQWADLASLALLRTVLGSSRVRGLHLVGAYRDNEVDSSHPLLLLVHEADKLGVPVRTIHLDDLSLANVAALVADTLSVSGDEAKGLARIIHAKTAGNAFFTTEFLKALHAERFIGFNRAQRRWEWDLAAIQARQITDNVVELMASRIRLLAESTQRLLRLAACIGGAFDLRTLAIISDGLGQLTRVVGSLAPAMELGVILRLDETAHADGADADTRFTFQHDRVQQAAYSLIPEAECRQVHLDIARHLLRDSVSYGQVEERLFEIVSHFGKAAAILTDKAERIAVARLYLEAGLKARRASAYHAALDYFRGASALLPGSWRESHYELGFDIQLALAKSCSIAGAFAEADALYPPLLQGAQSAMDKVRVLTVRMDDYHLQGAYDRAIGVQKEALSLLGERMPAAGEFATAIAQELTLHPQYLGQRTIAELLGAPEIESPQVAATLKALVSMWMSAYLVSREDLVQWSSVRLTNLSLLHGNSEVAAFAFVQFGYLCVGRLQRPAEGYEYGRIALALADRYDNLEMRGKIYFLFGIFINHWTRNVSLSTEALRKGYLYSVEAGDWTYAVYGAANVVSNLIISGVHCGAVHAEAEKYLRFLKDKATVGLNSFFLPGGYCALLNLQGQTLAPDSFDCEFLNEQALHENLGHLPIVEAWFYAVKIRSLYLHRCFDAGVRVISKAEVVAEGVPAQVKVPEAYFYSCLMLAAAQDRIGDAATRAEHWTRFRKYEDQMKSWAGHCPENYLHKYCLIVAERTRVEGGPLEEALGWYDQAIESAEAAHFPNVAAIARELKGRYWIEKHRAGYAAIELRAAHDGFQQWGATTKVALLETEFEALSLRSAARDGYTPSQLDLLSAHKASRAISGKIELPDLIETMMGIVMESAGADRGLLLRNRDGCWGIEADAAVGESVRVCPGANRDPAAPSSVPFSVIHYVARTQAAVAVDDLAQDPRFGQDPYVQAVQPKSMFCIPLAAQGRTIGILYLENKLVRGAFTSDRRDLVDVLAGQMAISLENAGLFADLRATVVRQEGMMADLQRHQAVLVRANHDLSEQRTRLAGQATELRALNTKVLTANKELEAFSYSISHDLRAPLRGMDGFSQALLEDYASKLDPTGQDYLHRIRGAAQRMGQLIDDMLKLSQVTRSEMAFDTVDLGALARKAIADLRPQQGERMVEWKISDPLPGRGDARLLGLVLENLLANALKFTGKREQACIEFGQAAEGGEQVFFIRDNGAGFDMAHAGRLFGAFQRLHSAQEFPGTGIGLATVQRIIRRHGGRVWAEGQPANGATFYFTLSTISGAPS